ncbi:MAG: hypothetical protein COA38_18535 [Fluviicola sp.]|nr:MAG: hypothetical protein COA38_18535 [Fluviicola sp.]
MALAKTIFARDTFPNLDKHITGEYNGHPNGTDLPENVTTDFLLLGQDEKKAVINITITDSAGQAFDGYLHFVKQDVWKITAFRALAMTGIIAQVKEMFENMTPTQIDSIIVQSKNDSTGHAMFRSREEYEYELGNSRLTLASDQEIINHFKKNEKEFNRIKDEILEELQSTTVDSEWSIRVEENHNEAVRRMYISSVSTGGYQFGNCLKFLIGGMVDNFVGYLFVKDKKDLPDMTPKRIIMIREIGSGWYMYKTT